MSIGAYMKTLRTDEPPPEPKSLRKADTPSRFEAKDEKDKDDEKKLAAWRKKVFDRDELKCRCCHCFVVRMRVKVFHPRRAEANHLAGRADKAVRYDRRNGITLCAACHRRVTGDVNDKLVIKGTKYFRLKGKRYIDGDHQVEFQEAA